MFETGDRVRTYSPVHGEMIGAILETDRSRGRPVYLVEWQTARTGVIRSRELAGLDDHDWVRLSEPEKGQIPAVAPGSLNLLMADAIDQDPALRSAHTRRAYRSDLARFQAWRGELPLTAELVQAYLEVEVARGVSIHARNRSLAAIRWWARKRYRDGLQQARSDGPPDVRADQLLDILAIGARTVEPSQRSSLTRSAQETLLRVCDHDDGPASVRDAALISLALDTGMKSGELAALTRQDLSSDGIEITLRVGHNTRRSRSIKLSDRCAARMRKWMEERRSALQSDEAESPLFRAIRKGGQIQESGLSQEALRQILIRRCRQAEVPKTSWQQIRRSLGEALLAEGKSVRSVGQLLGLSSSRAVSRLDRREAEHPDYENSPNS